MNQRKEYAPQILFKKITLTIELLNSKLFDILSNKKAAQDPFANYIIM